jgi:hypothetical protein
MVRVFHNGLCWFLSAVLLLTNGWPVAVHHVHDVDGNPYHHSHRTAVSDQADNEVSGVTEHVHMLWLGWEVTIVPPKGSKPTPPAAAVLSQQADRNPAECDAAVVWLATSPVVVGAYPVNTPDLAPQRADSGYHVAALPLCDTARHLRSGVQLI